MISVHSTDTAVADLLAQDRVLAVMDFTALNPELATTADQPWANDARWIPTPLPILPGSRSASREIWCVDQPVKTGSQGNIRYSASDDVLMASYRVSDRQGDLAQISEAAYQEILHWLSDQPQRHLWRIWNVFSGINRGDGDQERYRVFCAGRHQAFSRSAARIGLADEQYPAASAIGGEQPELLVVFLAGTQPSRQVENPRQVSAYHYPRQYGPKSPAFARASWVGQPESDDGCLLVSGTASIVGHESLHLGDWRKQLEETHRNIEALVDAASTKSRLKPQALRLYLRDGSSELAVVSAMKELWGAETPIAAVRGDICREELLLEIEGVWAPEK